VTTEDGRRRAGCLLEEHYGQPGNLGLSFVCVCVCFEIGLSCVTKARIGLALLTCEFASHVPAVFSELRDHYICICFCHNAMYCLLRRPRPNLRDVK